MTEPRIAQSATTGPGVNGTQSEALGPFSGGSQRRLWLLQACGFVLLAAALATIMAMSMRTGTADAWVAHTLETRRASGMLFGVVQDAEADVRAYLLIDDPGLIPRFDAARAAVPGAQARLRALSLDNPAQTARLDALAPLIAQRLGVLAAAIASVRSGDQQGLSRQMRQREGTALMGQIRAGLAAFDQAEADLLDAREAAARRARGELLLGISGALTLALLLGGFTTILSQRQAVALRDANARLARGGERTHQCPPRQRDAVPSGVPRQPDRVDHRHGGDPAHRRRQSCGVPHVWLFRKPNWSAGPAGNWRTPTTPTSSSRSALPRPPVGGRPKSATSPGRAGCCSPAPASCRSRCPARARH